MYVLEVVDAGLAEALGPAGACRASALLVQEAVVVGGAEDAVVHYDYDCFL